MSTTTVFVLRETIEKYSHKKWTGVRGLRERGLWEKGLKEVEVVKGNERLQGFGAFEGFEG
jgi:hypothetical protein